MIIQSVICLITDPIESPTPSPKGLIKLRIDPGAVEDLLSIASSLGKLEHRSTKVEDLEYVGGLRRPHPDALGQGRKATQQHLRSPAGPLPGCRYP